MSDVKLLSSGFLLGIPTCCQTGNEICEKERTKISTRIQNAMSNSTIPLAVSCLAKGRTPFSRSFCFTTHSRSYRGTGRKMTTEIQSTLSNGVLSKSKANNVRHFHSRGNCNPGFLSPGERDHAHGVGCFWFARTLSTNSGEIAPGGFLNKVFCMRFTNDGHSSAFDLPEVCDLEHVYTSRAHRVCSTEGVRAPRQEGTSLPVSRR